MRCDAQRATEISQNKTRLWPVGSSELARVRRGGEGDEGDEVIMSIAGQVSRASAVPYSHLRMEAKSRSPDEIAAREGVADDKRRKEAPAAAACGGGFSASGGSVVANSGRDLLR